MEILQKYSFEHRDLHWGNILVKPTSVDEFTYAVNGRMVSMKTGGVCATIIDYTLSRLQHGMKNSLWRPL